MKPQTNYIKTIILNLIGNITYLVAHFTINIVVVKLTDYSVAGIFALVTSNSGIFYSIALFSVRDHQVSDINKEFSNNLYITHRKLTCLISFICLIFYILINKDFEISIPIFLYSMFRFLEAFLDVYNGIYQQNNQLNHVSFSFALRGFLSLISFSLTLFITNNLNLSIFSMFLVTLVIIIFYDILPVKKIVDSKMVLNKEIFDNIWDLTKYTFPIFISTLFSNIIFIIPKNILERMHGSSMLGIFFSFSSILLIIQVVINLSIHPLIPLISKYYEEKNKKRIKKTLIYVVGISIFLGISAVVFLSFFGKYIFTFLFNKEITNYFYILSQIIITIVINVINRILIINFIIQRKVKKIIIVQIFSVLLCYFLSLNLVKQYDLTGTNLSTLIPLALESVIFFMFFIINLRRI